MHSPDLMQQLSKALSVPLVVLGGLAALAVLVTMASIFRQARGIMRPIAALVFVALLLGAVLGFLSILPK